MKHRARPWLSPLLAGLMLSACNTAFAQASAGLMLYPTRVVFEGSTRTAQIDLVNSSSETATYRLRLVHRRMTPEGELQPVEEVTATEAAAAALVRYSPRQVTLEPGTSQTVRLMLREPRQLPPGEYRSHLLFERIADTYETEPAAGGGSRGLQIYVQPVISVSIPIIVRAGQTRAAAAIANPRLETVSGQPILVFELRREGNRSLFGDFTVALLDKQGRRLPVGEAKGVAVYTPNPYRRIRLALDLPAAVRGDRLHISFHERGKPPEAVRAEAVMPLN